MASKSHDIVVLSSSPPATRNASRQSPTSPIERRVAMPATSSQSLSPLFSPKRRTSGALSSGSRVAPVMEGVGRGFATARSLLADISIDDRGLSAIEKAIEARRAPTGPEGTIKASKKPTKRATKKAEDGESADKPKPKCRRKCKASNVDGGALYAGSAPLTTSSHFAKLPATENDASTRETAAAPPETKTTRPRKPRAKKATNDECDIRTTTKSAKVTKPGAPRKTTKKAQGKAAEVVSAHFRSHGAEVDALGPDQQPATKAEELNSRIYDNSIWDVPMSPSARSRGPPKQRPPDPDLTLDLDAAVDRRRDWTPPPETVHQQVLTSSTEKENKLDALVTEKGSFITLLSGYSYAHTGAQPERPASRPTCTETVGVMKRRRVELVDVPSNQPTSRQSSRERGITSKKKPRTITDLVTGQYAPQPFPEPPEMQSNFFARRTTTVTKTAKVPLNDTTAAESSRANKKPVCKRSTSKPTSEDGETKAKAKAKKVSANTATKHKLVADKLLSPSSAALRMNRQDILFGTSSQLALEESPTMVREIQKAIRESEQGADVRERLGSIEAVKPWPRLQKIEGRRALWRASSRDNDGGVLEKQSVYLPEPDRTQDFPLLMDGVHEESDDGFLDIEDFAPLEKVSTRAPITISSDLPTPPPTIAEDNGAGAEDGAEKSSQFLDIDDFLQDPPPSGQNPDSSFLDIDTFAPSAQVASEPSLQAVAAGSPTKKRSGRPPKSQSSIPPRITASAPAPALKKLPVQANGVAASSPSTPKRGKTRFHSVEEILDSEDDAALSPTPPPLRPFTASLALSSVSDSISAKVNAEGATESILEVYKVEEELLTFEAIRPTLFPGITSLIRSLPPSADVSKPSWYEKILMYDPIVVEDFTTFLNTHPQVHTYKRATQKQIKAWNKELKRRRDEESRLEESLAVGEGDKQVLAVKKEVEAWMVQKWCEEMSICCISRERKNVGARKGQY